MKIVCKDELEIAGLISVLDGKHCPNFINLPSTPTDQCNNVLCFDCVSRALESIIVVEPEPTTNWIPCSERLPEKFEDVHVITDDDIQRVWNLTESYGQLSWEDEYGYWSPFENVKAWMPLPEPYKEGE